MSNFCNDTTTGYVDSDGFRGKPAGPGVTPAAAPASFPYGFTVSSSVGLTAHAGGGQTNALLLPSQINTVATVATAADSVKLPLAVAGVISPITVINGGAHAMQVFGSGTDTINGVATATGVSQAVGSVAVYTMSGVGTWVTTGAGTGDFTNLSVSGTLGVSGTSTFSGAIAGSPANANVVFSPTGTGVVTINPATAGTMDNVAVGQTTPLAGKFTTAVATSYNGLTITTSTGTLTMGANTLTLAGNLTTTGAFNSTFAQTASATYTLDGIAGTLAQTSGANLNVTDIYRCTTIQTANANVVPASITGLSGAVAIGTYDFEAALYTTVASGTAGIAINQLLTTAVLGVCNFEAAAFLAAGIATQATTTATSGTVLFTAADQPILILIRGSFTVTTAGTFGLQMCQNTSNASNSSVNVGSTMRLTRIA